MNTFFKYPGAKWRLAPWIIPFFPKHHSYLEAFMGSGGVFFQKPKSNIETINDMDGDVINLFHCIRTDPERLAREIFLTPYARGIYDQAYTVTPTDEYQQALFFLIQRNMGRGFRTTGEKVGWKHDVQGRERAYALKEWNHLPARVWDICHRLKDAQIEQRPAQELIRQYNSPNVLIYCDPPYLMETRKKGRKQYKHEMTDQDHEELLHVLLSHTGPALISGYDSPLYNDALRSWHKETTAERDQASNQRTEVLWMNFEPDRQISMLSQEATR